MKKAVFLMLIFSLLCLTSYAAPGDIDATLYNTDILTKVHGLEIESFSRDGEMLIKAEDLRNYGYTVTYDDTVRALFINKTGKPDAGFCPTFPRGRVGGVYGYTYETDIGVYYNGSFLKSYSLNGEMAVRVEELGIHRGLTYSYDDEQRLLTLDDADVPSKDEQIEDCLTLSEDLSFLSRTLVERLSGEGFDIIVYRTGGLPRPQTNYEYYGDDGKVVFLDGIFNRYGFHDGWGRTLIYEPELCGNSLKFKGESNKSRETLNFPEGEYVLDLKTHTISPND